MPLTLPVVALPALGARLAASAWFLFGPVVEDGHELISHAELTDEAWRGALESAPDVQGSKSADFVEKLGKLLAEKGDALVAKAGS